MKRSAFRELTKDWSPERQASSEAEVKSDQNRPATWTETAGTPVGYSGSASYLILATHSKIWSYCHGS